MSGHSVGSTITAVIILAMMLTFAVIVAWDLIMDTIWDRRITRWIREGKVDPPWDPATFDAQCKAARALDKEARR